MEVAAVEVGAAEQRQRGLRAWWARWRSDVLLACVVALIVVPVLQPLMAQQASRYALTAALVDGGTVVIDDYEHLVSVDVARRDGHLYSDKAPGQPALAAPAYALYRALGGAPAVRASGLADKGLWVVSLVSAALPAVALAVLMRRFALRVVPDRATEAALALATGTMLLPFATVLFSHVASALCALGAYLLAIPSVATGARRLRARLLAAGLVAGIGVTIEYTAAVLVLVIGAAVLHRHRLGAAWFAAGGVLPAVLLGVYHTVAFGGPLEVSYRYSRFTEHQSGLVGVRLPRPGTTATILFAERGLFVLTPIVLVGVLGLGVLLVRHLRAGRDTDEARDPAGSRDTGGSGEATGRSTARMDLVVSAVVFGVLVAINGGWSNPWAGASPGPRYVTPGLPFLVAGVAHAWRRLPVPCIAAAAASTFAMGIGTFTLPLAQPTEPSALLHWIDRAASGRWADTILTEVMGPWGILPPLVLAAVVAVVLLRGERRGVPAPEVGATG